MARGNRQMRVGSVASTRSRYAGGSGAYSAAEAPTQNAGREIDVLAAAAFAADEHAPHFSGEVMNLNHAGAAVVGQKIGGATVGRYGMTGLDGVESTEIQGDGSMLVRFANGERVIVDLINYRITSSVPGIPNPEMVAAVYEALAISGKDDPRYADFVAAMEAYHADRSDLARLAIAAAEGEKIMTGMDTFRVDVESQEAPTSAQERAKQLHEALTNRRAPLWVDRVASAAPEGVSVFGAVMYPNRDAVALEQARFTADDWDIPDMKSAIGKLAEIHEQPDLVAKAEAATTKKQLEAIAKKLDTESAVGTPGPVTVAARMKTARDLGLPLYEPDPNFVPTTNLLDASIIVSNDHAAGTRAFALSGPPGTGKNKFIYEMAAASFMPVFEMDFGAGDTMRDSLGDTGLKDGNTQLQVGTLAKALCAKGGCYAVYNEFISAPRGEQTALHNLLGSGLDQTSGRAIMFKSSEDNAPIRMELDPDSVQFLTYNPGRGDERPNEAIMRRTSALTFEYGSEDDETKKMCHMLQPAIARLASQSDPEKAARWTYDPEKTRVDADGFEVPIPITEQCPDLAEEVRTGVRFAQHLRSMYYDDSVQHFMDGTTLGRFVGQIIVEDNFTGFDDEQHNGAELAAKKLDFMFDQTLPPDERYNLLMDAMSTFYSSRMNQGNAGGIGI